FSSRRRHTRFSRDWSSDVCSSDLQSGAVQPFGSVVATVNLGGRSYQVYSGLDGESRPIVTYSATTQVTDATFDLAAFIDDAVSRDRKSVVQGKSVESGCRLSTLTS